MAEKCGNCCNLDWKNKDSYSSCDKYYCGEMRRYVAPTDYKCSYYLEDKNNTSSGSYQPSGCFLTTACLKHLKENFDDACYELTMLRWFRDNFVAQEDIKHYYEVAPKIVEILDNEDKDDLTYNYIYENIVKKCVHYIEDDEFDKAYSTYKNSVQTLEYTILKPNLEQRFINVLTLRKNNLA